MKTSALPLLLVALTVPIPAAAEVVTLACQFTKSGNVEYSAGGPADRDIDFSYEGTYRIDTVSKTVTANFTVSDEDETSLGESRYIADVRAIDAAQIVFCEDDLNGCAKKEVDTGRASGWRLIRPTMIDFPSLTMSSGSQSYFASASGNAWMSSRYTISGKCRRV